MLHYGNVEASTFQGELTTQRLRSACLAADKVARLRSACLAADKVAKLSVVVSSVVSV